MRYVVRSPGDQDPLGFPDINRFWSNVEKLTMYISDGKVTQSNGVTLVY